MQVSIIWKTLLVCLSTFIAGKSVPLYRESKVTTPSTIFIEATKRIEFPERTEYSRKLKLFNNQVGG